VHLTTALHLTKLSIVVALLSTQTALAYLGEVKVSRNTEKLSP